MASVTGRVNKWAEALVTVRLMAGREVECLVDTGARCALVLPPALVNDLGLPIVGYERDLRLAGGAQTRAPLALAQIEWLGEVRSVEVIVQEEFIVGTDLLEDARLVVDYRARTLVVLQKILERTRCCVQYVCLCTTSCGRKIICNTTAEPAPGR